MEKSVSVNLQNSVFTKNIETIARRDSELANRLINEHKQDPLNAEITMSKDGSVNLAVKNGDEVLHLHSRYDPLKEASELVDGAYDERRNYYIVFGFGLGYTLEELMRRTIEGDLVFLMEPNLQLFRKALEERDFSSILEKGNVTWSIGESPEIAFVRWMKTYNIARMDGLGVVELPSERKLIEPDYMKRFSNQLKGMIVTAGGNLQTLMIMARQYQANTLFNLRYILMNPPLKSLFGAFEGKPAIIVSAGPSLDKNIDLLHEVRDKVLIIAVDTSLKPLKAKGIEPHLICTGDPQEANYRHLRGASNSGAFLIAEPMTNPKSFRDFNGNVFIGSYGDKVVTWMEEFIPELGRVLCWGSVATMAFDVARKLGADPIIFIGQDLSFPGGRTYAKGTYFETEEKRAMTVEEQERNGVYTVEDIFGNQITTNRQMFAYHRWFVNEIKRTKAKVINATEGGILKEGVEILTLRETIDRYCFQEFDALSVVKQVASGWKSFDPSPLAKGMKKVVQDLYEIRAISRARFDAASEWFKGSMFFENLPKDLAVENLNFLEEGRQKMLQMKPAFLFLEMADQKAIKRFLKSYRMINGKKMGLAAYREVLEIYIKFYASLIDTLNYMIPHFEAAKIGINQYLEKNGDCPNSINRMCGDNK